MIESKFKIRKVDLIAREKRQGDDLIQFCDGDKKLQICMWQMAKSPEIVGDKLWNVQYVMMIAEKQIEGLNADDKLAIKQVLRFADSKWKASREALFATIGELPRAEWGNMAVESPLLVRGRNKLALLNRGEDKNIGDEIWFYTKDWVIGVQIDKNNLVRLPSGIKVKYQTGGSSGEFCLGNVDGIVKQEWKHEIQNQDFLKKILK